MNFLLYFFVAAAAVLIGLLIWALRPAKIKFKSVDAVFEALTAQRHYYRLPQILQALDGKDTEHLIDRGYPGLCRKVRAKRKLIALRFLDLMEEDYKTLLEASRMLAAMAPEVVGIEEWQRLWLSIHFSWNCMVLRFRLRSGLQPWGGFARLSELASQMSFRMEMATTQIGERAALASEFPSLLDERKGQS
ncbi:MAG TPA: hypothetical protein VII25_00230 [Candidatus Acidoferrum sp.]